MPLLNVHLHCRVFKIHVTTRNREFKDWIEKLVEHETYCHDNGEPIVNDITFKVCNNNLKLLFNGGTTVSKMEIPEVPPHQFKFKAIVDFLTEKFSNDLLYGEFFMMLAYHVLYFVLHSLCYRTTTF